MDRGAFRLSRIQAEGWNEAQRAMPDGALSIDDIRISALNPHPTDPERARWLAGFRDALDAGRRR
jgi:hypothetical protein